MNKKIVRGTVRTVRLAGMPDHPVDLPLMAGLAVAGQGPQLHAVSAKAKGKRDDQENAQASADDALLPPATDVVAAEDQLAAQPVQLAVLEAPTQQAESPAETARAQQDDDRAGAWWWNDSPVLPVVGGLGAVALLATGGGGDSGSTPSTPTPTPTPTASSLTGRVTDGPVAGAQVYIDKNGDGKYTAGVDEPFRDIHGELVFTDAQGNYTFETEHDLATLRLVATGGIDTVTGQPNHLDFTAPAGYLYLNPITTLIATVAAANNMTVAQAESFIEKTFGLADLDFAKVDIFSDASPELLAAQKVAAVLAAAGGALTGSEQSDHAFATLASLLSPTTAGSTGIDTIVAGVTTALEATGTTTGKAYADQLTKTVSAVKDADSLDNLSGAVNTHYVGAIYADDAAIDAGEKAAAGFTLVGLSGVPATVTISDGVRTVVAREVDSVAGKWVADLSGLNDGQLTATVTYQDAKGKTVTNATRLVLDAHAPDAPAVSLTSDTGKNDADGVTHDARLTAIAEQGAKIEYSLDGGVTWSASYDPAVLADGIHKVQVRATDALGNVSDATELAFTLDTQVAAPAVTLAVDTGRAAIDGITKKGTLAVAGAEAGAKIEYSIDGGKTWSGTFVAAEGGNTVQVRQIDAAGNVSAASEALSFILDTKAAAPTVALVSDTGTASNDRVTSIGALDVEGRESGAKIEYSIDGTTWSASFTPVEGSNTVQVRQIDAAGNVSAATAFTFTLDRTAAAPVVALSNDTGSSDNDHITSNATLAVTGKEAGAKIEYSIDGTTWSASFTPVEGSNTVQVRQIDAAGNVSAATAFTFTLDRTAAAPGVALSNDTGSSDNDHITNNATLAVTGKEAGARVEYSVDGTTWSASFTPVEGSNTVQVRQIDAAGNVSAATAFTFVLDTSAAAPVVALSDDTGSSDSDRITSNATLAVTGKEAGAKIEYSIDGTNWSASFTPVEGSNTVQVRQIDAAGNVSAATAFTFALDTSAAAPVVALSDDTGSSDSDRITKDATLTVTGIETGARVEYSIDGTNWSASFTPVEGSNTVQVRQIDAAGNVSAATAFTFTLDTSAAAPVVTLANDTGSSNNDRITNDAALSISPAGDGVIRTFTVDGVETDNYTAPTVDGDHLVQVIDTDAAGNRAEASYVFTLDKTVPAIGVQQFGDRYVSLAEATGSSGLFALTVEDKAAVDVVFKHGNNEVHVQYTANGSSRYIGLTAEQLATLGDGPVTVTLNATDQAGNTNTTDQGVYTLLTTAPTPTISLATDSGTAGDFLTNSAAIITSPLADGVTRTYSVNGAPAQNYYMPPGVNGTYRVEVTDTDAAGNTGKATLDFTLDNTAPTLYVNNWGDSARTAAEATSGYMMSVWAENQAAVDVEFRNGDKAVHVQYTGEGISRYVGLSADQVAELGDGAITVTTIATDAAGNVSTNTNGSFTLDTTLATPTLELVADTGTAGDKLTNDARFNFSEAAPDVIRTYTVDGVPSSVYTAPTANGAHSVTVTDTDTAGNTASTTYTFTLDQTLPSLWVYQVGDAKLTLAEATTPTRVVSVRAENQAAVDVEFRNGDKAVHVQYTGDGFSRYIGLTAEQVAELGDGAITVTTTATDAAGNVSASTNGGFMLDTTIDTPTLALMTDSGIADDKLTKDASLTFSTPADDVTRRYKVDGVESGIYSAPTVDGLHTVEVIDTDAAGNRAEASYVFTLDKTAPAIGVQQFGDRYVSLAEATGSSGLFALTVEDKAAVDVVFKHGNNEVHVQYTANGSSRYIGLTAEQLATLGDGPVTVTLNATDQAGNTNTTDQGVYTLLTTAPTPTISLATDSGTAGDFLTNSAAINTNTPADGVTRTYSVNGAPAESYYTQPSANGTYRVEVTDTDAAGNSGKATLDFTLDNTAPTLYVNNWGDSARTAAEATSAYMMSVWAENQAAVDVEFRNGDKAVHVQYTGEGISRYVGLSADQVVELGDGAITVTTTATDTAGNVSTNTNGGFVLDTHAPTATITMTDSALTVGETSTVTVTFSEAVTAFTSNDLTAPNGSLGTASSADGGVTWTMTFTPNANVDANAQAITLASSSYIDLAGNFGAGATSANYAVNTMVENPEYLVNYSSVWLDTNGDHSIGPGDIEIVASSIDASAGSATFRFFDVPQDVVNVTGFGQDDKIVIDGANSSPGAFGPMGQFATFSAVRTMGAPNVHSADRVGFDAMFTGGAFGVANMGFNNTIELYHGQSGMTSSSSVDLIRNNTPLNVDLSQVVSFVNFDHGIP